MKRNNASFAGVIHEGVFLAALLAALCVGLFSGCHGEGPDLAEVSGTVRLDGVPLGPDALVTFQPNGFGTYASAFTNKNGEYRLQYSRSRTGVMLGSHTITICTAPPSMGGVERVPPRYNSRTELTHDIKAGKHVIDFDLESGGYRAKDTWNGPK